MIILKHIKYSQVVKTLKIETDYGKNLLFSLNFSWKGTHLLNLKGITSCQTNNFRIKCEPLQIVYSIKLCTRCAGYIKYTHCPSVGVRVMIMAFNATFNNISVISWQSVLLVEETGVPWENHRPATSHWLTLWLNVVSSTPHLSRVRTRNVVGGRRWLHV